MRQLSFGYNFNQSADSLPPSIRRVRFGFSFNHPVNFLPQKPKFFSWVNYLTTQFPLFLLPSLPYILATNSTTLLLPSPQISKSYGSELLSTNLSPCPLLLLFFVLEPLTTNPSPPSLTHSHIFFTLGLLIFLSSSPPLLLT